MSRDFNTLKGQMIDLIHSGKNLDDLLVATRRCNALIMSEIGETIRSEFYASLVDRTYTGKLKWRAERSYKIASYGHYNLKLTSKYLELTDRRKLKKFRPRMEVKELWEALWHQEENTIRK